MDKLFRVVPFRDKYRIECYAGDPSKEECFIVIAMVKSEAEARNGCEHLNMIADSLRGKLPELRYAIAADEPVITSSIIAEFEGKINEHIPDGFSVNVGDSVNSPNVFDVSSGLQMRKDDMMITCSSISVDPSLLREEPTADDLVPFENW